MLQVAPCATLGDVADTPSCFAQLEALYTLTYNVLIKEDKHTDTYLASPGVSATSIYLYHSITNDNRSSVYLLAITNFNSDTI